VYKMSPLKLSALIAFIALAVMVYIFFPGMWTSDPQSQLLQGIGKESYNPTFSTLMTMLLGLFFNNATNMVYYLVFQVLMIFICTVYNVYLIDRILIYRSVVKTRYIVAVLTTAVMTFLPPSGYISMIIWKDILSTYFLVSQVLSVIVLAYSFESNISGNNNFLNTVALIAGGVFGALAMHFRHNLGVIVFPFFAFSVVFFYLKQKKTQTNSTNMAISILVCVMVFVSIFGAKRYLENIKIGHIDSRPQVFLKYMYHNDFLRAYRMGMKVESGDLLRIEELMGKHIDANQIRGSYSALWPTYHLDDSNIDEITSIEKRILSNNLVFWFKAKIDNAREIMFNPGGDVPAVSRGSCFSDGAQYGVVIDGRPQFNTIRQIFYALTAPVQKGARLYEVKFLWSNLKVTVIIYILSMLLLFVSMLNIKAINKISFFTILKDYKFTLMLPLIASFLLTVPYIAMSLPSEYRYVWPNLYFLYFLMIIWFRVLRSN